MKKAHNIQSPETRRVMKTWSIAAAIVFILYTLMAVIDMFFGEGSIHIVQLSLICGAPLTIIALWIFRRTPRIGRIPFFVSIFSQIAFLATGVLTQRLSSYFFIMLIIAGIFSFTKLFAQMAMFIAVGAVINVLYMIIVIPQLYALSGYIFFVQFIMSLFGSIILLIQTYKVTQKESRSDSALESFSSLLNATPNYMAITDSNAKVRYISRPMAEFTRFPSQELAVGKPLLDLFSDKALKLMFADILNADGFIETVMTINSGNEERHFKVVADKLTGGKGGLFIDISDVTPMVKSRKNAEEAQIRAEAANASKSRFLAAMSHEIRTPMNAILGITEMELEAKETPEKTKEGLEKIYASGYTLLGLINDILDLSKIETGKLDLHPAKYDMPSIINDTIHLNIMRRAGKPIKFILDISENLPSKLYGDELRIKQILNNLLSNAFKYTKKGTVTLGIKTETLNEENVRLIIRVQDTGQGMTAEQIERIFDEYSRFNMEANRTTEGAGLGMNITKSLVEIMNGKIEVESEPGAGTVFTVYVMQKAAGSEVIGQEVASNLKNFNYSDDLHMKKAQIMREYMPGGKVLIVDDVETNLYVAKGLMLPYGLKIETALSGFETLDLVRGGAVYDIIFMDHMMPKMDGLETTKLLREGGYTRPIVALTANAVVGQSEIFLKNGFDDFISKPIDIRQLDAVLNRLVRDKQPSEAGVQPQKNIVMNDKLKAIFARDAKKAIAVLEMTLKNIETVSNDDLLQYITNVHGMKSALAHIGEASASRLAGILERAGKDGDKNTILSQTQNFIDVLAAITAKNEPKAE